MTLSTQFGENITADEVEDAVLATLQEWMPTYVMAMETRKGIAGGGIPRPRGWQVVVDDTKWTEEQIPLVNVVSAGTADKPIRGSRGTYDMDFAIGVLWYVGGRDREGIRRLNRWYAAIIRETLLNHAPVVAGVSCDLEWLSEEYGTVAADMARTLAAGRNVFTIRVVHVVERDAGPVTAVADPYAPDAYPDLTTADTVISYPEKLEE
jgi:hypothetical protein